MANAEFIYTDYEILLRNIVSELYVYTTLLRTHQKRYIDYREKSDLINAKSTELLIDAKLKLLLNFIKKHDPPFAIELEEKFSKLVDRTIARQLDLFKLS